MPRNRKLLGDFYLWASPPLWWVFCPFPFLFFFYSKTKYLPSLKNVLLSGLFLLLDPMYSFSKNFPLFKTFPLSPNFLFQTLFFSKISSSLTFNHEWQNSNLLDLSWTISITKPNTKHPMSALFRRLKIMTKYGEHRKQGLPPLKKYGEHRKQGLPPLTSGARSISTRDSVRARGKRPFGEVERPRGLCGASLERPVEESREVGPGSVLRSQLGLPTRPPGQAGGEGRCRQPLGKDRPIWGLWRRPT